MKKAVRLIALFLIFMMILALFIGGTQPIAVGLFPVPWDKLVHAIFFFVFTLLLTRFIGLPITLAIILAIMVGALDEIHQIYLPGRSAGFDDFMADAVGVLLGSIRFKSRGNDI